LFFFLCFSLFFFVFLCFSSKKFVSTSSVGGEKI
jgi:hypothetical protein